jgi:regulator of protease activity HflC (stomatin/prohibitin superfamily)
VYVEAVYRDLRQDYEGRVVTPNIEESIKATTALFQAEELVTKRAEVKTRFEQILTERLTPYNIEVLSVSITDFQFSEEFARAIEAKVTQEQKALEAQNKLVQIEYEAQQQVIQAEAAANATVMTATAEAEAIRIINEQLTDLYLQKAALDQWNGELPYFYGGDVLPFIQIPTNATNP